jgi:hypothetical protein
MVEFFRDGGVAMYPVLVVGVLLLGNGVLYAVDQEPVRLRLLTVLSLVLLGFSAEGLVIDSATVFSAVASGKFPEPPNLILLQGLKESTRPLILGLTLWSLALTFVAVGVYRAGQRELRASRAA